MIYARSPVDVVKGMLLSFPLLFLVSVLRRKKQYRDRRAKAKAVEENRPPKAAPSATAAHVDKGVLLKYANTASRAL
jgi:hypothetical protein